MREINLLPPERRQSLRQEAAISALRTLVRMVALSFMSVTAAGALALVGLWLLARFAFQTDTVLLINTLDQYKALRRQIEIANAGLNEIAVTGRSRVVFSDTIKPIIAAVPSNLTIAQIAGSFDRSTTATTISLTGQASSRAILVVFQEKLQQLNEVAQVTAPTAILLERVNPTYEFNLTLNPPKR